MSEFRADAEYREYKTEQMIEKLEAENKELKEKSEKLASALESIEHKWEKPYGHVCKHVVKLDACYQIAKQALKEYRGE